ncbi:MAG: zinc metallopeptidase [Phycisphaerales bacterium]|nr:zinc metallopeptidase [Phycisphaerales bacterium]
MIMFDPMYLVFVGPAMLLAMWAQWRVHSAYAGASQIASRSRMTGAEAAAYMLRQAGVSNVGIEPHGGQLSDHYDPRSKMLRLSQNVYHGHSLASLGIAAHEAGHAIQDAEGYGPLRLRNGIVPMAAIGGRLSMVILMVGIFLLYSRSGFGNAVVWIGIGLFSLTVLFQLINLPVEFDASKRAKVQLETFGIIAGDEAPVVRRVLSAAALTYIAVTLTAILSLAYYLSLVTGRREE